MIPHDAMAAVTQLLEHGGIALDDEVVRVLEIDEEGSASEADRTIAAGIMEAATKGFFRAAASGISLIPAAEITQHFGRSLEDNYPEAGEAFLRFARTYWSLRIVTGAPAFASGTRFAHAILAKIERVIGSLFFPFPGPLTIDPADREAGQRELLRELGEGIDIEDFIRHNPILIRDRGDAKGGGCLGVLVCVIGIFTGVLVFR